MTTPRCTYLLPLRWSAATDGELVDLTRYVERLLACGCEVLVVDGSSQREFARHRPALARARHVPVDARWRFLNGKVNGVATGMGLASCERVILADDDVRYDADDVDRMCGLLDEHDLVVPQNHFQTLPWWARVETNRMLLNRALRPAGDYPGTFGIRRSTFGRIGPYDGDVLFENESMRRHFVAAGTSVLHARDFWIARQPPTIAKWREQRVRQAYEDLDLPLKTAFFALLVPATIALAAWRPALAGAFVVGLAIAAMLLALLGRRGGGARVIPWTACALAPVWVLERSIMVWAALGMRWKTGGCSYAGRMIPRGLGGAPAT